jgi:hypothetical protein
MRNPYYLDWMADNVADMRRLVSGQRILYGSLAIGFVVGLVLQIVGYAVKASEPQEPLGLVADLLYALGWALWTGVVVAVFVEIVPRVKRRQIRQAIDAYEALANESRAERVRGETYGESVASWAAWEMEYALGNDLAAEKWMQSELALLADVGGNPRHEALAHTRAVHLARRRADMRAQRAEAALARSAAARAGVADPAFAARIDGYLVAPYWVPHSM